MRRLLNLLPIIATVMLAGCVTSEQIHAGTDTLKGQSYRAAFARLGFPDQERKIAGYTVYSWFNQDSGSYTVPTYQTATTFVGGQAVYTNIQGSRTESYDYHCKLDIIVNSAGIVEDTKLDGNLGGCERYAALAPKPQPKKKPTNG